MKRFSWWLTPTEPLKIDKMCYRFKGKQFLDANPSMALWDMQSPRFLRTTIQSFNWHSNMFWSFPSERPQQRRNVTTTQWQTLLLVTADWRWWNWVSSMSNIGFRNTWGTMIWIRLPATIRSQIMKQQNQYWKSWHRVSLIRNIGSVCSIHSFSGDTLKKIKRGGSWSFRKLWRPWIHFTRMSLRQQHGKKNLNFCPTWTLSSTTANSRRISYSKPIRWSMLICYYESTGHRRRFKGVIWPWGRRLIRWSVKRRANRKWIMHNHNYPEISKPWNEPATSNWGTTEKP